MIFKSETHRPSSVKLWQMPHPCALPIWPFLCLRVVPLEAHETSYLADSARISNFSRRLSFMSTKKNIFEEKTSRKVKKLNIFIQFLDERLLGLGKMDMR